MQRSQHPGGFPYYGASGIIDWIDGYIFDGRYLLVAEDGENLNSRNLPVAFFAEGQFWVNNHAHVVRGKEGILDDAFLQYWFAQADIGGYVTGSAQPKLSQANMKRIELPLPPLPIQRKIAAILSAYDGLIENNNRRIKIVEEMARRIYHEWFVHFRYPGHDEFPLVDSELGPLPHGWAVRPLFEVADVAFGYPFKSELFNTNNGVPLIRIRDLPGGETATRTTELASEVHRVRDGDILIGMDGEFHMCRWSAGDAWLNQRVARLRPLTDNISRYALFLALEKPVAAWNRAIVGTTVAHLGKRHLELIRVVIPSPPVTTRIAELLEPIFNLEVRLRKTIRNLKAARDLLLPPLVSGAIDVANLNIAMPPTAA